ncbi:MAG: hypothetical protein Q7T82_00865 [Armatimonadota bacterium]|nr:hypothetical protein [Armatimonadota bacterium]
MKPGRLLLVCLIVTVFAGPALAADNAKCLMCHGAPGLSKRLPDGSVISLHIDDQAFRQSVHGARLCTDCHIDMRGQTFPHKRSAVPVKCSGCHFMGNPMGAPNIGPMTEYADSVHGRAVKRGDKDAPRCKNCHGEHDIRAHTDPRSSIYRANIPDTCGKCHSDAGMARKHKIPVKRPYQLYEKSVHGKAVSGQGLIAAAVCTDCHGGHTIKAAADPMSTVNKKHIPGTCGRCHKKILEEYKKSIHGRAVAQGVKDAPVCTNCHGEHGIERPTEPGSSVYPTHVVATCSKCHESAGVQKRFGLPAHRLKTYIGSYHGVANKFGETTVANCATCHGSHGILPSSDPHSMTNKRNLPRTCGKCHPGAGENFAKGSVHLEPSEKRDKGVYWVRIFYTVFIVGLIGSFALYILLDIFSRVRKRGGRAR